MNHDGDPETVLAPQAPRRSGGLRARIDAVGLDLGGSLGRVAEAVPGRPQGPQKLAQALGLDKVLTSRLLRCVQESDPIAVLHRVPGPEPLRRFLRAAGRKGVGAELVEGAQAAVERYERLLQEDLGDRASLEAALASWLPAARQEFELRRRQSAGKAIGQLKGVHAELDLSAAFLAPAADGERVDVIWVVGLLGLTRLRPGARVKLSSRRFASGTERHPTDLEGVALEGTHRGRLDRFCMAPPGQVRTEVVGDVVHHYLLEDELFGPSSARDLLLTEVHRSEFPSSPAVGRRAHAFSDVSVPTRALVFDLFVHQDLYAAAAPELLVHDTAIGGVADVNDPRRDADRVDVGETVEFLGRGTARVELRSFPRYGELVEHVHARLGTDPEGFLGYRVSMEHPLYGWQVSLAFPRREA